MTGRGIESTPGGRPGRCRWNLPPRLLATGPRALESSGQVILKNWISENLKCSQVSRNSEFQRPSQRRFVTCATVYSVEECAGLTVGYGPETIAVDRCVVHVSPHAIRLMIDAD